MISNKEYWVNLLFEVQTGNRSCRSAADVIMETINKENTMASEESKKKIDWDSMNELSKIYQEGAASYEKQCSEFWDKLSYDDQIAAFYSVVSLLSKGELIDKQSYRGILYDAFGFGPESYAIGMQCGLMELHNAIYHKDELEAWAKRNGYVEEIKND